MEDHASIVMTGHVEASMQPQRKTFRSFDAEKTRLHAYLPLPFPTGLVSSGSAQERLATDMSILWQADNWLYALSARLEHVETPQ